ncbi:MAG: hypothetical protein AAGJ70_06235 [Pseudomonadota bacterium]
MARLTLEPTTEATVISTAMSADTLFELGMMYSAGRDCDPDMIKAHKWFNLAALRGNEEARFFRTEVAREMSRREILEAQRKAREWLKRH